MRTLLWLELHDFADRTQVGPIVHPIPCGVCGRNWLRGFYSDERWGGDGRHYHQQCVDESIERAHLIHARVVNIEVDGEPQQVEDYG